MSYSKTDYGDMSTALSKFGTQLFVYVSKSLLNTERHLREVDSSRVKALKDNVIME